MPRLLCICGMHRSNTSAFAKALHGAGLHFDDALMEASSANIHGYFEDKDIINFEQKLLQKRNPEKQGGWYFESIPNTQDWNFTAEEYEQGKALILSKLKNDKFVWKSPRSSLLLTFWNSLFKNIQFVAIVRHPYFVARSLQQRGDMWKFSKLKPKQLWHAYNIWYVYNFEILQYQQSNTNISILHTPNLFVKTEYSNLVNQLLEQHLNIANPNIDLAANYDSKLLKTKAPTPSFYEKSLTKKAMKLYQALNTHDPLFN